jgi:antitoxin (DNA-binding transcriptional repressor) of toxin-antitoxin stability system
MRPCAWSTRRERCVLAGDSFVIAKAGKPMVVVAAVDAPPIEKIRRFGFLKGRFRVPADFDRMGENEIAAMAGLTE